MQISHLSILKFNFVPKNKKTALSEIKSTREYNINEGTLLWRDFYFTDHGHEMKRTTKSQLYWKETLFMFSAFLSLKLGRWFGAKLFDQRFIRHLRSRHVWSKNHAPLAVIRQNDDERVLERWPSLIVALTVFSPCPHHDGWPRAYLHNHFFEGVPASDGYMISPSHVSTI